MASRSQAKRKKKPPQELGKKIGFAVFGGAISGAMLVYVWLNHENAGEGENTVRTEVQTSNHQTPETEFEFYTLLPSMEVLVPDEVVEERAANDDDSGITTQKHYYLLQVGSFRSLEEADELKARLALLGIQSTIQTVSLGRGDVWHRVRVGPSQERRHLSRIYSRLLKENIQGTLVRSGSPR